MAADSQARPFGKAAAFGRNEHQFLQQGAHSRLRTQGFRGRRALSSQRELFRAGYASQGGGFGCEQHDRDTLLRTIQFALAQRIVDGVNAKRDKPN